uniref:Multidrug and toxin extrusion protein n=1 Tax=Scleropages formosus TaxID=113540 RepID=A0A8C9VPT2_SCLFO
CRYRVAFSQKMEDVRSEERTTVDVSSVSKPGMTQCSCSGFLRRLRAWIPVGYRKEFVHITKLAGPVFIAQLMVFLISFVSTAFCGHLGKMELAAVALATAIINITGFSVGSGLSSACDTLISQTYGSGNLKRVGVILQRGILIFIFLPFSYCSFHIFSIATFLYQLQGRYLQNQGIIWPQVITGAVGNAVNALINYIFLYVLDLGVAGSAAANILSQYSLALLLYIYILWRGLHKATWGGWSIDCLQEWGSFIRLAIPSMLMLCLVWWIYEIGGFLAGLKSEVELGAQSVIYEVTKLAYMFPIGVSVAANVRVGNALGSRDTNQAKLSCKVSMMCAVVVAVCITAAAGASKDVIAYIFTNDEQIRERVAKVMMIYTPFHFFDAIAGVSGGIVKGTGKQTVGAICNLFGYYCVGFPIGVSLMFPAKMGIFGLWIGLLICVILQSTFFIILIARLDWNKATHEAHIMSRQGCSQGIPDEMQQDEVGHTDLEELTRTEPQVAVSTVGDVLAFRTLVLRRGLIIGLMLVVLVGGILINLLLTPAPN